jgi:hypothetical protein
MNGRRPSRSGSEGSIVVIEIWDRIVSKNRSGSVWGKQLKGETNGPKWA